MDEKNNLSETHPLFPSGEWTGFYTYASGPNAHRHPMSFILNFKDGIVSGAGGDSVGPFIWKGNYDLKTMKCQMIKYYATHPVNYKGHVDENGIWGNWNIYGMSTGGFHIWPKKNEKGSEEALEEVTHIEKTAEKTKVEIID